MTRIVTAVCLGAAGFFLAQEVHNLVIPQRGVERCYEETMRPGLPDENGVPTAKSIVVSGAAPVRGQLLSIVQAIELIKTWESQYTLRPFSGKSACSATLEGLRKRGQICVETVGSDRRHAATTYRFDLTRDEKGVLYEGKGAPAIHIRHEYLPDSESKEALDEPGKYRLALILLHEAGHIQDKEKEHPSYAAMEIPIHGWVIEQAGRICGDPSISKALRSAIGETIKSSMEFINDPPAHR